jgi:hypothetical protein
MCADPAPLSVSPMIKPRFLHTIPAAVALIGAVALTATSVDAASRTQILHFFSKDTSFVYHNANGSIAPMPPNNPKSGDYFDSTANNYVGSHRHHAKHWTSSQHLHCAFGPGGPPTCQSQVAIGGSLLVFDGFKLTLGTGRYAGATGKASSKDVPGGGADTTATIHLR